MFNFLLLIFIGYYFYKNSVKTGKFQAFVRRFLPNVISALQDFSDRIDGVKNQRTRGNTSSDSKMSIEEARQILGVKYNATKEEINSSFKKLMMVNHPDKGGSEYIAAKIIQAKQTLIRD